MSVEDFIGSIDEYHLSRMKTKISKWWEVKSKLEGDKYPDKEFDKMLELQNKLKKEIFNQISWLWTYYLLRRIENE